MERKGSNVASRLGSAGLFKAYGGEIFKVYGRGRVQIWLKGI